jgi:hypothetical protein
MTKESFEQINRKLNLKLDQELSVRILNAVKKLPEDVYEYVIMNLQFEKTMDCCLPLPKAKKNFLVIEKKMPLRQQ